MRGIEFRNCKSQLMKLVNSFLKTAVTTIASTFLFAGCASPFKVENWKALLFNAETLQNVSIIAGQEVNGGYPLALDIVTVTDSAAYTSLSALRAAEWFSGKVDLRRQYQGKLSVLSWELVPGQKFSDVRMPIEARTVVGVVVFADYIGEQSYRAFIQNQKRVVIRLGRDDFDVVPE